MGYYNDIDLANKSEAPDFWDNAPIIYAYTRADAIADGDLIDVSPMAREAGFVCPVAVTRNLMAEIQDIPAKLVGIADVQGRLWDCIWMASRTARAGGDGSEGIVNLIMPVHTHQTFQLKMVAEPGDAGTGGDHSDDAARKLIPLSAGA